MNPSNSLWPHLCHLNQSSPALLQESSPKFLPSTLGPLPATHSLTAARVMLVKHNSDASSPTWMQVCAPSRAYYHHQPLPRSAPTLLSLQPTLPSSRAGCCCSSDTNPFPVHWPLHWPRPLPPVLLPIAFTLPAPCHLDLSLNIPPRSPPPFTHSLSALCESS